MNIQVLLVTSYWEDYAHSNKEDETMEESTTGERLLPSFNNCIELEPHNFAASEQIENDEEIKDGEVTDKIKEETKQEIKEQLKKEPIQVDDGVEKKIKKEEEKVEDEDLDMKNKNISEQEDTMNEKVEFSTAPNTPAAEKESEVNEDSKMDLD